MEQKKTSGNGGDDRNVDLVEFSVVLVATSNNPSILNPDFLRYNGIVDAGRQVQEPCISTPAYSQVTFEGGFAVKADPDRVIFEQKGDKLATEDIVCPEMAKRYLEKIPHAFYRAVGINPKGYRRSEDEAADAVADALIDQGAWMSFKDVTPKVQLKMVYRYDRRTISLDIVEAEKKKPGGGKIPGLVFGANVHRDITQKTQQGRSEKLFTILNDWKKDLSEFHALVEKFEPRRFSS